jgi:hypothetical protein
MNFCASTSPAVKPVRDVKHFVRSGCASNNLLYLDQSPDIFLLLLNLLFALLSFQKQNILESEKMKKNQKM